MGDAPAVRPTPWWPYVVPMAVFMALTWAESAVPAPYAAMYIAKVGAVAVALVASRAVWPEMRPQWRLAPVAVAVGLLVLAEWLLIPEVLNYPRMSDRVAFDPGSLADPMWRATFLTARLLGLVVLVPVIEELFWRSFLLRFLSQREWWKLPVGSFTLSAFLFAGAGFAIAHPEWLEAAICAAAYSLLLLKTRSLFACVVAHATTNLGLGVFILLTGRWELW